MEKFAYIIVWKVFILQCTFIICRETLKVDAFFQKFNAYFPDFVYNNLIYHGIFDEELVEIVWVLNFLPFFSFILYIYC